MDLGLEDLLATTNAEITKKSTSVEDKKEGGSSPTSAQSKQGNMDTDYGGVGNAIVTATIDDAQIDDSGGNPQEERNMLPQISPMKREAANRPMTTATTKSSWAKNRLFDALKTAFCTLAGSHTTGDVALISNFELILCSSLSGFVCLEGEMRCV